MDIFQNSEIRLLRHFYEHFSSEKKQRFGSLQRHQSVSKFMERYLYYSWKKSITLWDLSKHFASIDFYEFKTVENNE